MLARLLSSFTHWVERWDYDYLLVLQAYPVGWLASSYETLESFELIGPHRARQSALLHTDRDFYIMLDDDQEMLPDTSFKQAMEVAKHPLSGLVSIRQAPTPQLVADRRRRVMGVEPTPFVCTDGGMVLARHTADVIRRMPPADYSCDNTEWSLATYMAGLMNASDHDNWSLHRAGSRGGRRASAGRLDDGWLSRPRVTPDPRFVRYGEMKQQLPDVHAANRVGWTRGFTQAAHAAHHAAARKLAEELEHVR
jgi:hypothetical protein